MKDTISALTSKKLWLAPLAGITDKAFRTICKQCGADVVVSEMVSADGYIYNISRSMKYVDFTEFQRPFGIQIFGYKPSIMAKAVEMILEKRPDLIDINMGCPVRKVIKRGAGSALMKTPELAADIICEVRKVLDGTNIPLSAKIRSGWDDSSMNAVDFGKKMEDTGIDMICIHPRTRSQMFSGRSDWTVIKKLKEKLSIPVIGNGDIRNAQDAQKMFKETGCDSVMIGRGIIGNPWLFAEIKEIISNRNNFSIDNSEKLKKIKDHFLLAIKNKGEDNAIKEMRTHFSYYTKGFQGGAKVRELINSSFNKNEILKAIEQLYQGKRKNEQN
ncbi:MAG: tRNA dihydrouridine synthase DusB [Candidatus Cloacimonetes bacterium]|nr:tRNA dihydrouridine synthase DusB [Candidatus Cloacimonadota bacterium]